MTRCCLNSETTRFKPEMVHGSRNNQLSEIKNPRDELTRLFVFLGSKQLKICLKAKAAKVKKLGIFRDNPANIFPFEI